MPLTSQIFRERDELVDRVTSMKSRLSELQQKEEEAYQQVKRSVQMVEQAQLEQTQVRRREMFILLLYCIQLSWCDKMPHSLWVLTASDCV